MKNYFGEYLRQNGWYWKCWCSFNCKTGEQKQGKIPLAVRYCNKIAIFIDLN